MVEREASEPPSPHSIDRPVGRLFLRASYELSRSRAGRRALSLVRGSSLVQRLALGGPNPIRRWEEDGEFQHLRVDVQSLTLNYPQSLFNLYQLARSVEHVEGAVSEIGVYRGGTARLLAQVFESAAKDLFLFDTFAGMPDSIDPSVETWQAGDFSNTSLAAVVQILAPWPRAHCLAGTFPDTAKAVVDRRFCLVHVDVDIAQSVQDCCEFFYPRLSPGAAMVFDDYGFRSCQGARHVVDTFFADKPEYPIYFPTGQCAIFRSS